MSWCHVLTHEATLLGHESIFGLLSHSPRQGSESRVHPHSPQASPIEIHHSQAWFVEARFQLVADHQDPDYPRNQYISSHWALKPHHHPLIRSYMSAAITCYQCSLVAYWFRRYNQFLDWEDHPSALPSKLHSSVKNLLNWTLKNGRGSWIRLNLFPFSQKHGAAQQPRQRSSPPTRKRKFSHEIRHNQSRSLNQYLNIGNCIEFQLTLLQWVPLSLRQAFRVKTSHDWWTQPRRT